VSAQPQVAEPFVPAPTGPAPIVIVGAGPVGMRVAEELLRRDPASAIVIYGDEPWEPYQRIQLSAFLLGEIGWGGIENRLRLPSIHRVDQRHHCAVVKICRAQRSILDATGHVQAYARLILATGSHPHVPQIAGIEKSGVFTFRNLNDAQRLMARSVRSRRTIVLGGGLLGLEAARALSRRRTEVILINHAPRLMNRQLDEGAAQMLKAHVEKLGIHVMLNDSIREVVGDRNVTSIRLHSGLEMACDTVVVATGIRPNVQLAADAGLSMGRGVRVDDGMHTSDPFIYAVGECCEHRDEVIGLVAPGLEQAAVAAHNISGGDARYEARVSPAQLKVLGLPVFSMGATGDDEQPARHTAQVFRRETESVYRRLVLERGRLVGAIVIGEWNVLARLQEAITHRRRLHAWELWRFRQTGELWGGQADAGVTNWPAAATVCNCAGVTRGTLSAAVERGCITVECLTATTAAGRVCGSCKPLLAQLVGATAAPEKPRGRRAVYGAIAVSLVVLALFLALGPLPIAQTVQGSFTFDRLWADSVAKQITGYALLALALASIPLSLRKRWPRFSAGNFGWWRAIHVVIGAAILAVLVAHTGLRMGAALNLWLMSSFLLLSFAGVLAGLVIATEGKPGRLSKSLRAITTTGHILLLWPLPALLGFHILMAYYF